ncbi:SURF1 family protein [Planotetraspora phitsanulokensis]|uniref:SURF1-like protein n=1 Tax=Planotetraspora phitsanulokensis TaxID=575192 RepID=A0A8J3U9T9_9ACTN|nr:SURF1 family protein [Planotetraspora phitsanulokensis]GII40661.1 SURF1-like protein [Planotetraspora phitsanulokensis]
MLRTLFAPRLVALHLLVIGVLISFTLLGRWQLGVFESSGEPKLAPDPAPVTVTELATVGRHVTGEVASRRVTATGTFDAHGQLLVADRHPDVEAVGGRAARGAGFWLLTPLRLTDGTTIPIVRGWVPSAGDSAAAVPPGPVTVTGRLRPSEQTDAVERSGPLPDGQVATVSTAELVNVWSDAHLRDGFVVATSPAPPAGVSAVAVPPPTEGIGFSWRNLAYAAQWWIFAVFAVFMWFHFVRDAVRNERTEGRRSAAPVAEGS